MINEKNFESIIDEVIDNNDKIIVLYSGIWTFIDKLEFNDNKIINIPKILLSIFEKKIGKKRTLFIPAFTGKIYSKKNTIHLDKDLDKSNGLISFAALKKKYYRTKQPIHSYFVYGNLQEVKKLKLESSWGEKSLLEYFSKKNARICNLGLTWNKGCAYLHRFEEIYNVPWRYNKKITAKFFYKNKFIGEYYENKFCSSSFRNLKYDFKPFVRFIRNSKSFKKTNNKDIVFESIKTSCLDKIGKIKFYKNPWVIIKNKVQTKNWIKNEKKYEMTSKI